MTTTTTFFRIAILLFSTTLFVQCTSETRYVDIDNDDQSIDAAAVCIACHSNEHRAPIRAAYAISTHAIGGHESLGTRGDDEEEPEPLADRCSRCHSNEGFVDYIAGGLDAVSATGYQGPTKINCLTCHNIHRSFDFENDGNDYALRHIDPVLIETAPNTYLDLGDHSNLCIKCHQPRNTSIPVADSEGMFEVTGTRFGPHHGPQSTMFEGIQGVLIAGTEAYPGVASGPHREQASCIVCHMGPTTDGLDGSHTWFPTLNACIVCHPGATDFDIGGVQSEVATLLDELEALLFAEGIVNDEGRSVPGVYPIELVNAYWNWKSIDEDGSLGVHNPEYTLALLKNSIQSLE